MIRALDYQPATGRPDAAEIRIDGDLLYETGDSGSALGASYQEIFRRITPGSSICVAARLVGSENSTFKSLSNAGCLLILLDDWFLFAEPRSRALPTASNLADLMTGAPDRLARSYLDCEYSFGRISDGNSAWKIQLSTLPFRTGQRLFPMAVAACSAANDELSVDLLGGAMRWQIIESSLASATLADLFLL